MDLNEAELEAIMRAIAENNMGVLIAMYPEVAKTDMKRIELSAQASAIDIAQYGTLRAALTHPDYKDKITLMLDHVGIINPRPETVLQFASPARLEYCKSPNEILSSLTILALAWDDSLRALLYFHGYRLKWQFKKPPADDLIKKPSLKLVK